MRTVRLGSVVVVLVMGCLPVAAQPAVQAAAADAPFAGRWQLSVKPPAGQPSPFAGDLPVLIVDIAGSGPGLSCTLVSSAFDVMVSPKVLGASVGDGELTLIFEVGTNRLILTPRGSGEGFEGQGTGGAATQLFVGTRTTGDKLQPPSLVLPTTAVSPSAAPQVAPDAPEMQAAPPDPAARGGDPVAQGPGVSRVEVAAGLSWITAPPHGFYATPLMDAGINVALGHRWSLEGGFDVLLAGADDGFIMSVYHAGVRWTPGDWKPGGMRPYLSMGGAGWFAYTHMDAFDYVGPGGERVSRPSRTWTEGIAPYNPYLKVGFRRPLGRSLALTGEVAAIAGIGGGDIHVILVPSIGLSFGFGRLPSAVR